MRNLNVDWHELAKLLPHWAKLTHKGRMQYLELKASNYIRTDTLDPADRDTLLNAKLLATTSKPDRLRLPQEAAGFSKAMRAMRRNRLISTNTEAVLDAYVQDCFTLNERHILLYDPSYYNHYSDGGLAHVSQETWPQQLLDQPSAKAALQWEKTRLPDEYGRGNGAQFEDGAPYFSDSHLFDATKQLLAAALTWPRPVPLSQLAEHVPGLDEATLHRAIMPALRYLMLFVWLDSELMPVIGLLPRITMKLHRPAPVKPQPIAPELSFHAPILAEDMTSLLVAAAAEPLRVLATGGTLYAKDMRRIADSFVRLPDWLYDTDAEREALRQSKSGLSPSMEQRVRDALQGCMNRDYLESKKRDRGGNELSTSSKGSTWLSGGLHDRIRSLVSHWRQEPAVGKAKAKTPAKTVYLSRTQGLIALDDDESDSPWLPPPLRWSLGQQKKNIDWRAAFIDALSDADGRFVPLGDLLEYHCRVNNPLLGRREKGTYGPKPKLDNYGYGRRQHDDLESEDLWYKYTADLIMGVLFSLGAIEYGLHNDQPAVRLHSIGRYMLGLTDDFDYQAAPQGSVIIQPNFEVTFLGAAPQAEARLGRLAERTGTRVGTLFRITRNSILAAAAAGITADDALRDLTEASSKPVPDNVLREVRGWFNTTRQVRARHTWLIDTPDEQTAIQIRATCGAHARQVTPTLVELTAPKAQHATLFRKLKQSGIFVK